jgi:hypothetical protein
MGWDKKKFRVNTVTMKSNGLVGLVLEETDPVIYSDISDQQAPTVPGTSSKLPKPTGLQIVPPDSTNYPFPSTENVYGYLVWDTYAGDNLLRYEVQDWRYPESPDITVAVPYNRTIDPLTGSTKIYHPITDIVAGSPYTFKVRIVDRLGNVSKYAIINKTFSALEKPATYSAVTGFKSPTLTDTGTYIGGTVEFEWDLHPSPEVTAYQIKFLDKDTLQELGIVTIQSTEQSSCKYSFTIDENMSMYADKNAGSVGAYRDYLVQIRANATNGSSDWVYL